MISNATINANLNKKYFGLNCFNCVFIKRTEAQNCYFVNFLRVEVNVFRKVYNFYLWKRAMLVGNLIHSANYITASTRKLFQCLYTDILACFYQKSKENILQSILNKIKLPECSRSVENTKHRTYYSYEVLVCSARSNLADIIVSVWIWLDIQAALNYKYNAIKIHLIHQINNDTSWVECCPCRELFQFTWKMFSVHRILVDVSSLQLNWKVMKGFHGRKKHSLDQINNEIIDILYLNILKLIFTSS